jgi:hypothetical protein
VSAHPLPATNESQTILDVLGISAEDLTEIADENPNVFGVLVGYTAETKLKEQMREIDGLRYVGKPRDSDRKKKGDLVVEYHGQTFKVESKSLQSGLVKKNPDGTMSGKAQCDGSDSREVLLPDGSKLKTTCLLAGEFDILAINLFAFGDGWKFAFIRNRDLPKSNYYKYTDYEKQHLLATLVPVELPLQHPYYGDLEELLDEMVEERRQGGQAILLEED